MTDGFSGARGTTYEMRFCMLCLVRGYTRGLTNFRLRYQVPESEVGKFDDLVFDKGDEKYQVFQLKHKEDGEKYKISSTHLFNQKFNAEFNLLKYVISYFNTMKNKVDIAVVMTNIDFDFENLASIQLQLFTPTENVIFDNSKSFPDAKCYKFDNDPNIVHQLKQQAVKVSKELRAKLKNQKLPKYSKKDDDATNLKYENQQKQLRVSDGDLASFLENLTEDKIRKALKHIVYAVRQPNDTELRELLKTEIRDYFKLQNVDTVYNALEVITTNWCNMKQPFVDRESTSNPHVIDFKDAEIFFQQNVKNVSFGNNVPTSSFTGRFDELKKMREKLAEKQDVIVSQSVTICGLGGIGKTELTKQFIKEYGQSDFYGRVIWIEAENDETVKKSFRAVAEIVDIPDIENKTTTTIIDRIFDYFNGVKVLFVFDNFDKSYEDTGESSNDQEKNLVIHCRKKACDTMKKNRPYFIFTSRNRECLPDVFSLDLGVLTKEDAKELIKKGLIIKNYTDQDAEELSEALQCFPLALQQAIAYIKKQHEIASELGGGYDIQKYLKELAEKKGILLNYPCKNDFDEHGKTTLVTWNITFDAIRKDKINGQDAIEILQLMSYLYADKIDAKMFLPLFKNDSTRTGETLLLLKKYSLITKIGECYKIHRLVQTVVQLNLKENEEDILKHVWELIFPKLFESYFDQNQDLHLIFVLMSQCTNDQFLHYNNLATYIKSKNGLKTEFMKFISMLHDRILIEACFKDDIDKLIKLQLSHEALKEFLNRYFRTIINQNAKKIIKYLVENEYLDLNDDSILFVTLRRGWFDMFKYLVEKGANLNKLKLKASKDIINDIIRGNTDSLLGLIESKRIEENLTILREALFFASLLNQESIVELLIAYKVEPDYEIPNLIMYSPIEITVKLMYPNILKILLKSFDNPAFKYNVVKILVELLQDEAFCDKNYFEIIFRKYQELGGDINANQYQWNYDGRTFLLYATYKYREKMKIEIIHFLLDNGANPLLRQYIHRDAFTLILLSILRESDSSYKDQLKHLFRKMRSNISNEKFITRMNEVFNEIISNKSINEISDLLLDENGNINFRNDNGETLLINYVRRFYGYESVVKFLLDQGIDVDAKDNNGKNALFYAVDSKPAIFDLLLTKVSSVGEEILIGAIKKDKVNIVKDFLKSRFKPNHIFGNGKTIIELILDNLSVELMFFKYQEIKKFSFQNGAAELIAVKVQMALVKYLDKCNKPADFAKVDCLLDLGADVNAIDKSKNNALHYAVRLGDDKTFRYLLSKGCIVHSKTLRYAIEDDELQIVQAIIPEHFKKNHCLEDEFTPIKLATKFKAEKVLKFLTDLP